MRPVGWRNRYPLKNPETKLNVTQDDRIIISEQKK